MTTRLARNMKKGHLQVVTYMLCFLIVFLPFLWEIQPAYAGDKKSEEKRIPEQTSVPPTDNRQTSTNSEECLDQIIDPAELQRQVMDITLTSIISMIDQRLRIDQQDTPRKKEIDKNITRTLSSSKTNNHSVGKEQIREAILTALSAMLQTWKSPLQNQSINQNTAQFQQNATLGFFPQANFEVLSQKYGLPQLPEESLLEYEIQVQSDLSQIRQAFEESNKIQKSKNFSFSSQNPLMLKKHFLLAWDRSEMTEFYEEFRQGTKSNSQVKNAVLRIVSFIQAWFQFEFEIIEQVKCQQNYQDLLQLYTQNAAKYFPAMLQFNQVLSSTSFSKSETKVAIAGFTGCQKLLLTIVSLMESITGSMLGMLSFSKCRAALFQEMIWVGSLLVFTGFIFLVGLCQISQCSTPMACDVTSSTFWSCLKIAVIASTLAAFIFCFFSEW